MRFLSIGCALLAALASSRAALLLESGFYTITVLGRALTQDNGTAFISADPVSGATNQVWLATVNGASATLQNLATFAFAATNRESLGRMIPSETTFTWFLERFDGQNLICGSNQFCMALVSSEGELSLIPPGPPGISTQLFDANPVAFPSRV